jgi:GLPGLI family protein
MKQLITILFVVLSASAFSQARFIDSGKIIYERKIAQVTLLEATQKPDENNIWIEEMKKAAPRIVTDSFSLSFNKDNTYYAALKESQDKPFLFQILKAGSDDFVAQDYNAKTSSSIRNFFDHTFYIKDSIKNYTWKIGNEVRDIAGFECRKATTKICDSVVIVAFYTEQITPSVGPENFNGLPGAILGIAVPRLSLTLFATRIELSDVVPAVDEKKIKKFKPTTRAQVNNDILKVVKDWGDKEFEFSLWGLSL